MLLARFQTPLYLVSFNTQFRRRILATATVHAAFIAGDSARYSEKERCSAEKTDATAEKLSPLENPPALPAEKLRSLRLNL